MEAAEHGEGSEVRRVPDRFDLDSARCILCGLCVQACPHEAIAMGEGVALPIASTAEQLLGNEQTLLLTRQA
jgi:formate hydrogenlyase subunit 6/NADH:ubiquinone oxidoreductase subunit I